MMDDKENKEPVQQNELKVIEPALNRQYHE